MKQRSMRAKVDRKSIAVNNNYRPLGKTIQWQHASFMYSVSGSKHILGASTVVEPYTSPNK
jgi:hypothetical protein